MSKLSRFYIGVIIVGLAFIVSLRFYRAYEQRVQEQQEQDLGAWTFNNVPVSHTAAQIEIPVFQRFSSPDQTKDVFLEDAPLDISQQKEQARQTVSSILLDYKENPQLRDFYQDIKNTTGTSIGLEELSGENMQQLFQQYPQLQEVMARHMQDPEFAKMVQEIFSNPQFVQSIAVLQLQEYKKN